MRWRILSALPRRKRKTLRMRRSCSFQQLNTPFDGVNVTTDGLALTTVRLVWYVESTNVISATFGSKVAHTMSTEIDNELEAFHRFIGERLENGGSSMTADEALQAFRTYQRDVERLRQHVRKSDGDDGKPLDDDALKERVRKRLAEQGVTD